MEHSQYRGATIYHNALTKHWWAILEDGMYTYSILTYDGDTLAQVKQQIKCYYHKIGSYYPKVGDTICLHCRRQIRAIA